MKIKKVIGFLHLWLGMVSGIIVFIVCLTACFLVFEDEIKAITEPYQQVVPQQQAFLPPSAFKDIAWDKLGKNVTKLSYGGKEKAVVATLKTGKARKSLAPLVYFNPYNGEILKVKDQSRDFFRFMLTGHYYAWLPLAIGKIVVPIATLMFVISLISGIILWYPQNAAKRKRSFAVRLKSKWKRLNYDLHNVLGFYSFCLLFVFGITGLVFGFKWFASSFYWTTSGGKPLVTATKPKSSAVGDRISPYAYGEDRLWKLHISPYFTEHQKATVDFYFPAKKGDCYTLYFNPDEGVKYRRETRYFDQFSLEERYRKKGGSGFDAGSYASASFSDKLKRMNYDIHVGSIGGLLTKTLAFLSCLIGASLPLTGYVIWWNKRLKSKKREKTNKRIKYERLSSAN